MPLTPEAVRNKQFTSTRLRSGYNEHEVDVFLDEVEAELTRLLAENAELRSQVEGGPPPREVREIAAPRADDTAAAGEDPGSTALRTLQYAQRIADEAVSDARREAESIVGDARARAAELEREVQEQRSAAFGDLDLQRAALEAQVEGLRSFEREYRARLRVYLESQLRALARQSPGASLLEPAGGASPGADPAVTTPGDAALVTPFPGAAEDGDPHRQVIRLEDDPGPADADGPVPPGDNAVDGGPEGPVRPEAVRPE